MRKLWPTLSCSSLVLVLAAVPACNAQDDPIAADTPAGSGGSGTTPTGGTSTSTGGVPSTGGGNASPGGTNASPGGASNPTGGSGTAGGGGGTAGGGSGGSTAGSSAGGSGPAVSSQEDTGLECEATAASGPNGASATTLPDPFTNWAGVQVKNMTDWRCRRRELVVEIEKRILGPKAPPPSKLGGAVSGTVSSTA